MNVENTAQHSRSQTGNPTDGETRGWDARLPQEEKVSSVSSTLRCIVLVLALQATAGIGTAEKPAVERGRVAFEQALAKLRSEREAQEQRLLKEYSRDLGKLEDLITREGNLDRVLAVRMEKQRIGDAADITEKPPGAFPALDKLWRRYRAKTDALTQNERQAVRVLADRYDKALMRMQTSLTKQKRIDEALAVRQERERVAAHPDVVSARTLPSQHAEAPANTTGPQKAVPGTAKDTSPAQREPVRLQAVNAKCVGNVRVHNDPPRVGILAIGAGLDWGRVRLPRGHCQCILTYSAVGRETEKRGVAEVTVGGTVLTVQAHGTAGWGTPFCKTLGTIEAGLSPIPVSLAVRAREPGVAGVFDVWQIEFVPVEQP